MDSTTLTRQVKLEKWAEMIRARNESGLTISRWCKENSVNEAKYYYWLKRVRQSACETLPTITLPANPFVPIAMEVPIKSIENSADQSYAMRITVNGFALEFTNEASERLIENALKVLRHAR